MFKLVFLLSFVAGSAALAQSETTPPPADFSPPPLVPVQPPPVPAAEPGAQLVDPAGTPPPPSAVPPPGYVPGQPQTNYPYSPYGTPRNPLVPEQPPVEWGLWLSESLFGMLTSSAVALIPYFLLLRPMVVEGATLGNDAAASTAVFVLIFAALPMAVSQTQLSIANGSRYYSSDTWPAALAGLGAQAAVLGLFFAIPRAVGSNCGGAASPTPCTEMFGRNEIFLLVGSIAFVPLVQMAVINLTKSPRMGRMAAVSRDEKGKVALGLPVVAPIIGQTKAGLSVGVQASLLNVTF